jgi:hypothetical protein
VEIDGLLEVGRCLFRLLSQHAEAV